ncbi:MAG TPA: hypothetical protein VEL75_04695 [Candidatus Methylomirabilis sp.]|nr:hypothetical protein [Gemmatimonadaceae bacterium]HYB41045.1 hypothetical protein [Candidatus Methylomirabilis sp.]
MRLVGEGGRNRGARDAFLSWAEGLWELDGEIFELVLAPDGSLIGRMMNGVEVSAAWVISRGHKVPTQRA